MRFTALLGVLLGVALTLLGCGGAKAPVAPQFTLDEQAFSVQFPAEPVRSVEKVPAIPGAQVILYTYNMPAVGILTAMYVDYPPKRALPGPAGVLAGARDGAIASVPEGRLLSSTSTAVDGSPALDAVASFKGGNYQFRAVLVGRRLYQLAGLASEPMGAAYERFLSSFRLKHA